MSKGQYLAVGIIGLVAIVALLNTRAIAKQLGMTGNGLLYQPPQNFTA